MIANDTAEAWRRREMRRPRLGGEEMCVLCRHDDVAALERHHLFGVAMSDQLVTLCLNCHRAIHTDVVISKRPSPAQATIDAYRLGAAFLRRMAGTWSGDATSLLRLAVEMDCSATERECEIAA